MIPSPAPLTAHIRALFRVTCPALLWVFTLLGLWSPSPALAQQTVVTLTSDRDNTLYESATGALSNGAGEYFFAGSTDQPEGERIRRGLLRFDIASVVPAGATIDAVQLDLDMSRTRSNSDSDVSLHRVLADWGEGSSLAEGMEGGGAAATAGDATWLHRVYDTTLWTSSGAEGDFAASASATTPVGREGDYSWTSAGMAADVQAWLDDPDSNFGWVVLADELSTLSSKRFGSHENTEASERPLLTVTFTPGGGDPVGGCCFGDGSCGVQTEVDCLASDGSYQGDGSDCEPNVCPQPLGACCLAGSCTEVTDSACTDTGGAWQGMDSTCATATCPVSLTPYLDPLPIPADAVPLSGTQGGAAAYEMHIREIGHQFHAELPTGVAWGFGDGPTGASYPGPTLRATRDQPIDVTWVNDLRELGSGSPRAAHYLNVDTCAHGAADQSPRTVVHLHGGHVPAAVDGYPEHTWLPGESELYTYPNNQEAATLWFHDHALGITRLNVYMGLAGFYLISDAEEQALDLPRGAYDIPLVIQDRTLAADGTLVYPELWQDHFAGEHNLVNGKVTPYLDVDRASYRFRVLNGSNGRHYTLSLSNGAGFTLIGTDGGLRDSPLALTELTLGPGERAELVVDFSAYAPGTQIELLNSAPMPYPGSTGVLPQVMQFVVGSATGPTPTVPGTLRAIEPIDPAESVADRQFVLDKVADPCAGSKWLINGLGWDDITEFPELDTVETWTFVNPTGSSHPMHMHLVFFQVLDRTPVTETSAGVFEPSGPAVPPDPSELGWKDTVDAPPGMATRVIARFTDYTGKYAYHCHILEHEDHEMMRQFQSVDCGNGVPEPTEQCDDGNNDPGDACTPDCLADSDVDGITDDDEQLVYGTSPTDADTDDDGLLDGEELGLGTDPLQFDTDEDGLGDGLELGRTAGHATDTDTTVFAPDTDPGSTTDPLLADSDAGGAEDGVEDADGDGAVDGDETDPNAAADDGAYVDADGDGSCPAYTCVDGSTPGDCDDADPANFPGNPELCDGQDNDCSGAPLATEVDGDSDGVLACADCDDADASVWDSCGTCVDGDADGWFVGCDDYTVLQGPDCDDADSANFPGNPELCDGRDNDCDGSPGTDEIDADSDGALACADCDDADASAYPGHAEICDEVDNDCDEAVDEGLSCDTGDTGGGDSGDTDTGDTGDSDTGDSDTGEDDRRCGCQAGGGGAGWLALLAVAGLRRRAPRRRALPVG